MAAVAAEAGANVEEQTVEVVELDKMRGSWRFQGHHLTKICPISVPGEIANRMHNGTLSHLYEYSPPGPLFSSPLDITLFLCFHEFKLNRYEGDHHERL